MKFWLTGSFNIIHTYFIYHNAKKRIDELDAF